MIYSKKEIQNANLHIIKTDKFKTITVNVRFKRPLVKEEITKRNFLVNCLMESTKKCPTRRLLEIESEELYNLILKHFLYFVNSLKVHFIIFSLSHINSPSFVVSLIK